MQPSCRVIDTQALCRKFLAEDLGNALQGGVFVARRLEHAHRLAVVAQAELDLAARQRQRLEQVVDMRELGALGTHKFASRRHIVEKIAHFDAATLRVLSRPCRLQLAAIYFDTECRIFAACARGQRKPGYRRYGGQRFSTKTHAGDMFEIVETTDLAGGMRSHCQRQFVLGNTAAVIAYADQARTALLDVDFDAGGAGVEAVFHQLFHYGRRAFDYLAGGNLVDQFRRKRAYGRHRASLELEPDEG